MMQARTARCTLCGRTPRHPAPRGYGGNGAHQQRDNSEMQGDREKLKLVKCWMVNREGAGRHRFVELEMFRLWEYLVTHKHGMRIEQSRLCLWVSKAQYDRYRRLFAHARAVSAVNQVTVERYDHRYRISNFMRRYCLDAETNELTTRLERYLRESGHGPGDWNLEVTEGRGIEPEVDDLEEEPLALGLS